MKLSQTVFSKYIILLKSDCEPFFRGQCCMHHVATGSLTSTRLLVAAKCALLNISIYKKAIITIN